MIRVLQIAVSLSLAFVLVGCNGPEEVPIWEQVKITDLAPVNTNNQSGVQPLKTINFKVYIFEIPADEIRIMDKIWPTLYTQPLRFNKPDSFSANSFLAGFGQIPMWNRIADLLRSVDGIQAGTVSLLILDGQSNDVGIAALGGEEKIFYITDDGTREGLSPGAGQLGLRIKADRIPSSRGVCKVSMLPVFSPPRRRRIPLLDTDEKSGEMLFTSIGFSVNISPGDFILLGPEKYEGEQITLCSMLFSKPEGSMFFNEVERKMPELKPSVRLFLLVCTGINY